ncbi:MAG: penicillin-binding protein activator LpoB [Victivallales bacterium]|jgi:PBP1b-binding outer membrane lipoprotein LpoB|nr:penicillin-binding protein activator LpoB [Victivallales bacterium]
MRFFIRSVFPILAVCAAAIFFGGCQSPTVTKTVEVNPDDDPLGGAISSGDVRTVASSMAPAILALPEFSSQAEPVRIAVAGFQNNSRFIIDKNIFMRKLRMELNQYSAGKLRFFAQESNVAKTRGKMLTERQRVAVREQIAKTAKDLAGIPLVAKAEKPLKIALLPGINTNLVDMNADSFTVMMRSALGKAAAGKINFLMPGVNDGADYYLVGQFYVESTKREGIVNPLDYVDVIRTRLSNGQSLDITDGRVPNTSNKNPVVVGTNVNIGRESELVKIMRDQQLRNSPNLNKYLNVMLVAAADKTIKFEDSLLVDAKITDKTENATYILSGQISSLSQRKQGNSSDYLLISVQLTDSASNEIIWEKDYETKRVTQAGIVYQ